MSKESTYKYAQGGWSSKGYTLSESFFSKDDAIHYAEWWHNNVNKDVVIQKPSEKRGLWRVWIKR